MKKICANDIDRMRESWREGETGRERGAVYWQISRFTVLTDKSNWQAQTWTRLHLIHISICKYLLKPDNSVTVLSGKRYMPNNQPTVDLSVNNRVGRWRKSSFNESLTQFNILLMYCTIPRFTNNNIYAIISFICVHSLTRSDQGCMLFEQLMLFLGV